MEVYNTSRIDVTMQCDAEEITRILQLNSTHISINIVITLSVVAMFVGTKTIFQRIRRQMTQLSVVVVGAGPIGLTSALIAVRCQKVSRILLYEEQTRFNLENKGYQIAIQPSNVAFLRSYGIDFDNLEGIWHDGCFYTRVGIYLEYLINVIPLYQAEVEFKFNTKFDKTNSNEVDNIPGRKLVLCCDGSNGFAARALGISDECVHHSSQFYGAVAAIERHGQTLVPTPEKRVHNLSFDLTAYGSTAYDEDKQASFSLKIFGNSRSRNLALAVNKCESSVAKALKRILDKSIMRNIFLKCYNTYKRSEEASISDSYCLNNMKYSPRLFEIKLSQRIESVAYIDDCDLFIITEGEASRSYNFNTGMDINLGLKGLAALQPFIEMITWAENDHSIMKALIYKMEHSDKLCKEFLKYGIKEYLFL